MEVHAHTHTERKKWTHYLWEFIMLFLAVFCGFLAENQREHMVEHQREKQYMQSMLEDLIQDTLEIKKISLINTTNIKYIDTLLNILRLPLSGDIKTRQRLYAFMTASMGGELAIFSQRTLSQLKNAGGLRLVRKKEVADLISLYDSKIQYLLVVGKSLDETTTDATRVGSEIFDLNYYRADHDYKYDLISYDAKILKKFSNCAQVVQSVFYYYEDHLQEEKQVAIRLIQLIKKQYHISERASLEK